MIIRQHALTALIAAATITNSQSLFLAANGDVQIDEQPGDSVLSRVWDSTVDKLTGHAHSNEGETVKSKSKTMYYADVAEDKAELEANIAKEKSKYHANVGAEKAKYYADVAGDTAHYYADSAKNKVHTQQTGASVGDKVSSAWDATTGAVTGAAYVAADTATQTKDKIKYHADVATDKAELNAKLAADKIKHHADTVELNASGAVHKADYDGHLVGDQGEYNAAIVESDDNIAGYKAGLRASATGSNSIRDKLRRTWDSATETITDSSERTVDVETEGERKATIYVEVNAAEEDLDMDDIRIEVV